MTRTRSYQSRQSGLSGADREIRDLIEVAHTCTVAMPQCTTVLTDLIYDSRLPFISRLGLHAYTTQSQDN